MRLGDMGAVFENGSSPKLGWIIIYGISNRIVNFMATTFAQVIRKHYKVVKTYEDAMRFIEDLEGRPLDVSA